MFSINHTYRQCKIITIEKGDTLGNLAVKYSTTVADIILANPELDLDQIEVGQEICIPTSPKESVCPIGSIPYNIQAGDTLSSIATKYKTTNEQLLISNPQIDPKNLQVGDTLCITEQKLEPVKCPSLNIYVIKEGDALYKIADQFGITVDSLLEVNPGINTKDLNIDQVICLPLTPTPYIIVIDLNRKSIDLYYVGRYQKSYPIAIGKPSTPTPVGNFQVMNKQVNPGGPFGTRWMGLTIPSYGIHGTNNPASIGTAASNGCIRMYNKDVEELFSIIAVNTPVVIL